MTRFCIFAVILLVATPALAAQHAPDPDEHILRDYVLTMTKLKAYDTAYTSLTTAAKTDKSLQADVEAASSEASPTIASTIARMDHHPRVYAFFQKQGLSKTEAALLPLILLDACTAVQYPQILKSMPGMIGPAQIDFCKANQATIKTMKVFAGQ